MTPSDLRRAAARRRGVRVVIAHVVLEDEASADAVLDSV